MKVTTLRMLELVLAANKVATVDGDARSITIRLGESGWPHAAQRIRAPSTESPKDD